MPSLMHFQAGLHMALVSHASLGFPTLYKANQGLPKLQTLLNQFSLSPVHICSTLLALLSYCVSSSDL